MVQCGGEVLKTADGQVQWTNLDCGDLIKTGKDPDGNWYTRRWLDAYWDKFEDPEEHVGLFWTGGLNSPDDFKAIYQFNNLVLQNKGKLYYDIHTDQDFKDQGLDRKNKALKCEDLHWRAVYRASKAIAIGAMGGTAYIHIKPNNCRDIFSEHSQKPKDSDPIHGNRATNGEVWYFSELPMLMRNLKINKIVAFYRKDDTEGEAPEDFVQDTQWDANAVCPLGTLYLI